MTKEKTISEWFKEVIWKEKTILITLVLGLLSTLGMFAYNNYSPPKDNARLMILEEYISNDRTDKAVIKSNISTMKESMGEIKVEMREGFKELGRKMDDNNRTLKIVKENTK